jgi:hypothetical protein
MANNKDLVTVNRYIERKLVDWTQFETHKLGSIILDIQEVIDHRLNEQASKQRRKDEKEFFDIILQKFTDNNDPEIDSMEDAYKYLVPGREKYRQIYIDDNLSPGECPPCFTGGDCWWEGNMDRLGEFDGQMYELMFTDQMLCKVCYNNGFWIDKPYEYFDMNEIIGVYEDK